MELEYQLCYNCLYWIIIVKSKYTTNVQYTILTCSDLARNVTSCYCSASSIGDLTIPENSLNGFKISANGTILPPQAVATDVSFLI